MSARPGKPPSFGPVGPEEAGIDPGRLDVFLRRVRLEVDHGSLPSAQVAVARNDQGRVLHVEPEYDDVKKAALELNVAVDVISEEARRAWSSAAGEKARKESGRAAAKRACRRQILTQDHARCRITPT